MRLRECRGSLPATTGQIDRARNSSLQLLTDSGRLGKSKTCNNRQKLTLVEIADELCHQLTRIFLRDKNGRRPDFGACEKMQTDPHFRDYVLFLNDERSRDNSSLFWRDTEMKNAART